MRISDYLREWNRLPESERRKKRAAISMWASYLWAGVKALVGIFGLSFFILLSGLYSACLGLSRHLVLDGMEKCPKNLWQQREYYAKIILILFAATAVFLAYMIRLIFIPSGFRFSTAVAAFAVPSALVEFVTTLLGAFRQSRTRDLLVSARRWIDCNGALSAVVLALVIVVSRISKGVNSTFVVVCGLIFVGLGLAVCLVMLLIYRRTGKYLNRLRSMDRGGR